MPFFNNSLVYLLFFLFLKTLSKNTFSPFCAIPLPKEIYVDSYPGCGSNGLNDVFRVKGFSKHRITTSAQWHWSLTHSRGLLILTACLKYNEPLGFTIWKAVCFCLIFHDIFIQQLTKRASEANFGP